jgi:hypothetical protein
MGKDLPTRARPRSEGRARILSGLGHGSYLAPYRILREATQAVPAVRYALGVAGIIAVVAIVSAFGIGYRVAFVGALLTLVLMVALVVFAKLTTTAPRHFLMPVQVLMWSFLVLCIATAVLMFTSVFFKRPIDLQEWIRPTAQAHGAVPATAPATIDDLERERFRRLVKQALEKREAGDHEGAWKLASEAVALQPDAATALTAQEDVAMDWLRTLSYRAEDKADHPEQDRVVGQLAACLDRAVTGASPVRAARLHAHLGWSHVLRLARNVRWSTDVDAEYKKALAADPGNVYGRAMLGHWILYCKVPFHGQAVIAEADVHFRQALKTGLDRPFVRRMQVWGLFEGNYREARLEMIRLANEIRLSGDAIGADVCRVIEAGAYHRNVPVDQFPPVPFMTVADHISTYVWLIECLPAFRKNSRRLHLAELAEQADEVSTALSFYQIVAAGESNSDQKRALQGLERCRKLHK